MDAQRYLDRLGVSSTAGLTTDVPTLATLQLAHLTRVAFENLDVFHRRGVSTDVESSYAKIVERGRGGWCFELNGAFGWLLGQVGYDVDLVSCQVWGDGTWGPAFDHLALVVHIAGRRFLADVGFGDSCISPIELVDSVLDVLPRPVRCVVDGDEFVTSERQDDGSWMPQLRGSFVPRALAEFDARSRYLQTEPGLSWSEKLFATRALDATGSRVTLRRNVLRTRTGAGISVDRHVETTEWSELLALHFGIDDQADDN